MPAASPTKLIVTFATAGIKAFKSKLRGLGVAADYAGWPARAEACERCPMRVVQCNVSYCGQPFLRHPVRDPVTDGCGCPTRAKAKDPAEHCPVTRRHDAPTQTAGTCDCKWCEIAARLNVLHPAA